MQTQPVIVVLPPRTLLLDVAGPLEVLRRANLEADCKVRFAVELVAARPTVASSVGLCLSGLAALPATIPDGAIVLLGGSVDQIAFGPATAIADDAADEAALVDWLRRTIGPEHTLACVCSGALLAARAGLLDGHDCTTHHLLCAELARLAPAARVLENRLYVEDRRRLSSAGVTAGTDLLLHLVQRLAGPAVAAAIARHLVLYLRRNGALPQLSPWLSGRNHLHAVVHRVQDAVTLEPARNWSLAELARIAHTSPRHLSRLFSRHAGLSLHDWCNALKVELARQLLDEGGMSLDRIAERAGFGSARQFRRAWARCFALSPSEWRARNAKLSADGHKLAVAAGQ